VVFAEGLAAQKHSGREAIVEKSRQELKQPPQDSASHQVNPDEAESGWERETEEIQGGDEETKVVLLPVNPHLVYVYWEISARDLEDVSRVFSRLGPRARPLLRFYDTAQANFDSLNSGSWFEVAIALGAGKWYVRLENPASFYCVDLGLRLADGSFHRLARSNPTEMPKTGPSDKLEERYLLVDGNHSPAEVVAAGEGRSEPRSAPSHDVTQVPRGRSHEFGEALRTVPASAELQGREADWPEHSGASGPVLASAEQPGEEVELAVDLGDSPSRLQYHEPEGDGELDRELGRVRPSRAAPAGEMERQIAEFYQQRSWEWVWWAPRAQGREESPAEPKLRADLTELSERSFCTGLSSWQKSS
jgi:hypothetical protein